MMEAPFTTARKTVRNLYRNYRLFKQANSKFRIARVELPEAQVFSRDYLISSEQGVFAIADGQMLRLTKMDTYGLAIRDGELFVACSSDSCSVISKCRLPEKLIPGETLDFSEIFHVPTTKSGRIHQIGFYNDTLGITQSSSNSLVFLDPSSGEVLSEFSPFRDAFGEPILGDHNHINSLSQCGECLLFCAYHTGPTAMIGVYFGNRVKGYPVKNKGAHDVYLSGKTLYFSDTFGETFSVGTNECGFLMANNCPVDPKFFNTPPGFAIRGIAQQGEEMILGHSHKGPRSKRFKGKGSLFRLVNDKVVETVKVPFAQVYEIIGLNGDDFEVPPAFTTWDEINQHLETVLGPAIYEFCDTSKNGEFER